MEESFNNDKFDVVIRKVYNVVFWFVGWFNVVESDFFSVFKSVILVIIVINVVGNVWIIFISVVLNSLNIMYYSMVIVGLK